LVLVVVPCGKSKIWKHHPEAGPVLAALAYVGPLFKVNREFAERHGDRWVILSAKYGFIDPDFVIPKNYDVTFKNPATGPIDVARLKEQVKEKGLDIYTQVIALGGREYVSRVKAAFVGTKAEILAPTEGLSIGKMMQKMRELVARGLG
jgi:hypothetical protein